jgi:hypothetical protein
VGARLSFVPFVSFPKDIRDTKGTKEKETKPYAILSPSRYYLAEEEAERTSAVEDS